MEESRAPAPVSRKGRLRVRLERMLEESGARYTIVRLPEFYGPNVTNVLRGTIGIPGADMLKTK